MLVAYLESIKYVGHLWPVALIRIVLGYNYLSIAIQRLQAGFLEHAYLSEKLLLAGDDVAVPGVYFEFIKHIVQTQWLLVTFLVIGLEMIIGLSYIVGYGVRITALFGIFLTLHLFLFFDFGTSPGQIYLLYIHILFCLLGAGRCLGVDYYFYKSRRGLIW